ncbi:MAG TPA: signal recognition particle-docking protein FtsY [Capsulimonadaceae bacterium]|nr:signal recognition particle-docking protein FtsY [Capsulimonadaceae bacterium]
MLQGGFFKNVFQKVDQLFVKGSRKIDEDLFEELEEALVAADLNIHTTLRVMEQLRSAVRTESLKDADDVKDKLREALVETLVSGEQGYFSPMTIAPTPPTVYLVVGVNGVGKTTSIAKMAYRYQKAGNKVVLAAGDTFRAAAIDQLQIWGQKLGVEVVRGKEGGDPAAVVFDALQAARARGADYVICDTAGRLHTRHNLMEELKKINRVLMRERGGRPADETLLVLDATTGQNAISQAKEFKQAVDISGLILAKLDSTARGGIVITIKEELNLPIKLIGTGEQPEDMEAFEPQTFVKNIFA